jgi:addiction module RelE/StbE family toxin
MARLEWSERALFDLERLHQFLHAKNPRAADVAIDLLLAAAEELIVFPDIGRPFQGPEDTYRELIVPYSNSGYLILYRYSDDTVEIQSVRHQSEAGY